MGKLFLLDDIKAVSFWLTYILTFVSVGGSPKPAHK